MKCLFIAAALAASTVVAHAQPAGRPGVWKFDATGWTLLGTQAVHGKTDRDTIIVGRHEGKFDELNVVVTDSDLRLEDFTVVFANGERFQPKLKHVFKEGARSRAIDLPGNNRAIAKIEVVYKNLPRTGRATFSVYARDKRGGRPAPRPPAPVFDARGWTSLGSKTVNGRRDRDTLRVPRYKGTLDQITLVVSDSDLELKDLTIRFANGKRWSPRVTHSFRDGQRTRAIDLPGKDRTITQIDLAYANTPGGGNAKVQVYGRDRGRPAAPPIKPVTWQRTGWTQIVKSTVDGWRDRDAITVRSATPFTELMFVASGSDLEIANVVVTFGNNETFAVPNNIVLREGQRTVPVDLPGKQRRLKKIDVVYRNLAGGGRAGLEVWGRVKPQAQPPRSPNVPPPTVRPAAPVVRDHR